MRLVFAISFVLLCRCGKSFGSDFLAGFLARRASEGGQERPGGR